MNDRLCVAGGWWCLVHPHLSPLPSRERGNMVGLSCSPSPLIPLPSRERGMEVVLSFVFGHGQVMVL